LNQLHKESSASIPERGGGQETDPEAINEIGGVNLTAPTKKTL